MDTAGYAVRERRNGASKPVDRGVTARQLRLLTAAEALQLWPTLASHILLDTMPLASRAPWSEEKMMAAVLRGQLEVWVYLEEKRVLAVVTTTVTGDAITGEQALLIYSVSGAERLDAADWQTMFVAVSRYAKAAGASRILAYSNVERVLAIVSELGGTTAQRLCELPVLED